ncbi:MAG TPA: TMEM165/GDT1 family protein [Myxococcota bacterium]|nr:TMEM165/GDT1 family protein [Myxococcota bacterium]
MRSLLMMFLAIFVAELGDKTQIATVLFASGREHSPWLVFLVASLALVCASALAVGLGRLAGEHLQHLPLKLIAGVGFVALGALSIAEHFRGGAA